MVRKAITDCFFTLIHETHKFSGAAELLDILASIISGFAVPLREEHVQFFKNVIIPLHKVQTSNFFFEQLLRCSMLFLSKDRTLALPVLYIYIYIYIYNIATAWTPEILAICQLSKGDSLSHRTTRSMFCMLANDFRFSKYVR